MSDQEHRRIRQTLAAAAGDDPDLREELLVALRNGACEVVEAMAAAMDDVVVWCSLADRLRGLALSFGALDLANCAREAERAVDSGGEQLGRLRAAVRRLP